jgi:hypothetical protein
MKKLFTALLLTATMFALNVSVTFASDIGIPAYKEVSTKMIAKFDLNKTVAVYTLQAQKACAEVADIMPSAFSNGKSDNAPVKIYAEKLNPVINEPFLSVRHGRYSYKSKFNDNYSVKNLTDTDKPDRSRWLIPKWKFYGYSFAETRMEFPQFMKPETKE